jgi:ADP-dependent NAD(P)H-hydrate dehydratase
MTEMSPREQVSRLPAAPARPRAAHKGTFGKVLIVAGSRGMSGAACLSGIAALRGGAGLVTVGTPACIQPVVAGAEFSYLTFALSDDREGKLSLECAAELVEAFGKQTAGALGPGLGQSIDLEELVCLLYRSVEQPLVIDADALNLLANRRGSIQHAIAAGPRILTPHPGEFSRLTGLAIADIEARRLDVACEFAADKGVIVVLKGAETIITDGRRYAINQTGNSGMATGGSGDVLTGLIAALLAQKMEPFAAAQLGVHLHGLAGDLAAAELSEPGLISSDLPRYVARAFRTLDALVG